MLVTEVCKIRTKRLYIRPRAGEGIQSHFILIIILNNPYVENSSSLRILNLPAPTKNIAPMSTTTNFHYINRFVKYNFKTLFYTIQTEDSHVLI